MLGRKSFRASLLVGLLLCSAATGHGGTSPALVLGTLALFLVAAKVVGDLFERVKQPAVLGELLAGVLIGNLPLVGVTALSFVTTDPAMGLLAEIGVVILLFEVGLESDVSQMLRVGASAFLVATVGVVVPMALGYFGARWILPGATWHAHVFIGAILSATSVGITARVLKDLGKIQSTEGRIILGAAVIDDVLGLIVLAVVQGIVLGAAKPGGGLDAMGIAGIVGKSFLFLGGAIALGRPLSRWVFRAAQVLQVRGLLLAFSVAICFAFSFAAHAVELAPIVGAFAAGLILDEVSYKNLLGREEHGLEDQVRPLAAIFVPVFFVVTGAKVDLTVLADSTILGLAGVLTAAAIIGKQACSFAVLERGVDRLSVGLGMIPRGEVGLIFASVGTSLILPSGQPVVDKRTYAAAVVMVIATTLVTPPILSFSLGRKRKAPGYST
ncbi:MAG: cation:proton antiporter [Deltaproteobacteria bacterium]|nr:cation:proton antiporter [Deltaproteobacteria bacterium]